MRALVNVFSGRPKKKARRLTGLFDQVKDDLSDLEFADHGVEVAGQSAQVLGTGLHCLG